jgi:hypothetical protein
MIPTSSDVVHRTSVSVGDNAELSCAADVAHERAIIVLGEHCEIAMEERALRRLHTAIGDALAELDGASSPGPGQ